MTTNLQLTAEGKLKHFLTPEGLSAGLLTDILDKAETFFESNSPQAKIKSVPLLHDKTVVNLFFENSTRTAHNL